MKYYIYISDAKVDMLLPQVPHETRKKLAPEFGFDLKLFKVSRSTEEHTEGSVQTSETAKTYSSKKNGLSFMAFVT